MQIVGFVIAVALQVYFVIFLCRMVLSWVPVLIQGWQPRGPLLVLCEVIYSVTDPPLRALRRVFRPVRVGNVALDISFIAAMVALSVLMWLNRMVFGVWLR